MVVVRCGGPSTTADLKAKLPRQGYLALDAEARPAWSPERLTAFLKSAVESEAERGGDAYRLDGIWHDNGGDFDLVAWGIGKTLIVEAKGVTAGRSNASRAIAEAVGKIALNIRSGDGYSYGILVPEDERTYRVLASMEGNNPLLEGLPITIYTVDWNGRVRTWDRASLAPDSERLAQPGSSRATRKPGGAVAQAHRDRGVPTLLAPTKAVSRD